MKRAALRTRLVAALLIMLTLICLVIGFFTHTILRTTTLGQLDAELQDATNRAVNFREGSDRIRTDDDDPLYAPGQASGTLTVRVSSGLVASSGVLDSTTGERVSLTADDLKELTKVAETASPQDAELSVGEYRVLAKEDHHGGFIIVGLPTASAKQTLRTFDRSIITVATSGILVTGVIGWLIIRRSLRPLERVSSVATSVADSVSDLSSEKEHAPITQRVDARDAQPGTEVGNVGSALNNLLDNVDQALTVRQRSELQMRNFAADASHELRTPLAAVRGYSELIRATEHLSEDGEKSIQRVLDQSDRMSALVENLLLLARLDQGQKPKEEPVDLSILVAESVQDQRIASADHQWKIQLPESSVTVRGDRQQLAQVLSNLLSNARKHTPEGSEVTASLRVATDRAHAELSIQDNGPGITPEFLPYIFKRFARADKARSGTDGTTGLGLPIVKAIVEAHGGTIVAASRPGHTEFVVRLPLAVPPQPDRAPSYSA
ncbi:sensor histidine kinase [Neomicrococcus lactis]|uniref:sensor histidine kinase n=1 Tax=Neomicrococcus lactis TaxID=732241 RepID=UPI00230100CF|nr:HAMP domain-containing sensor histidine kinase [Neomicrococcus lactis]